MKKKIGVLTADLTARAARVAACGGRFVPGFAWLGV